MTIVDTCIYIYMVMNAAQVKSSEYETLQVGTGNTTVTPTETIKKKGKDLKKKQLEYG